MAVGYVLQQAFANFGDRAAIYVLLIVAGFAVTVAAPKLRIPTELMYIPPCIYIVCELFVDVIELGILETSKIVGLARNIGDEFLMLSIGVVLGMIVANKLYDKQQAKDGLQEQSEEQ